MLGLLALLGGLGLSPGSSPHITEFIPPHDSWVGVGHIPFAEGMVEALPTWPKGPPSWARLPWGRGQLRGDHTPGLPGGSFLGNRPVLRLLLPEAAFPPRSPLRKPPRLAPDLAWLLTTALSSCLAASVHA